MNAEQAFHRDIPKADQEDVLTMICESAHGQKHDAVTILDIDRLDAINVRVEGILQWNDEEYSFHVEDGNWNGTVIREWEGVGEAFERHKPTVYALQPNLGLVSKAVESNRGAFLIAKWDAFLTRADVKEIPNKYMYDKHFAPGGKTETYWKEAAAKHGFVIVTEDEASRTRAMLAEISEAAE